MGIEINPFSIFYFFCSIPATSFIFTLAFGQTLVIIKGITSKQADSILQFQRQFLDGKMINNEKIELKNVQANTYSNKYAWKEISKNFLEFFTRKKGESLVFKMINQ